MTQRGQGGAAGLALRAASAVFVDAAGAPIEALCDVDCVFLPGCLSVVTGASGAGKSTLLHALAGILKLSSGQVIHDGKTVSDLDDAARTRWRLANCGLVFQDFRLIEELDALGNVLLPASFCAWRASAARRARALGLLQRFDVPSRAGTVSRLSRGEQQRVALARALLLDPPLVLADEPTASLDAANAQRVGAELQSLAREGRTIVAISHDERLIDIADTRLTLSKGRLLDAGSAP